MVAMFLTISKTHDTQVVLHTHFGRRQLLNCDLLKELFRARMRHFLTSQGR